VPFDRKVLGSLVTAQARSENLHSVAEHLRIWVVENANQATNDTKTVFIVITKAGQNLAVSWRYDESLRGFGMTAQIVDDTPKTERRQSTGVFWGMLGWVFATSVVGGVLYAVIIVLLATIELGWGHMGALGLGNYLGGLFFFVICGAGLGAYFGILLTFLDAIVLALLIRIRLVQPRIYGWHRLMLYLISATLTSVGLAIEMHPMAETYPGLAGPERILLPTTIAALGGWWAARRVLTSDLKQESRQLGTH
jgi:hypothetical protein